MANSGALFDVLVVGGGNAGMCAAIMARRAGAQVLVLESATKDFRGGNSRHTRDIRYMHQGGHRVTSPAPYEEEEFWEDLLASDRRRDQRASGPADHSRVRRLWATGCPPMACAGKNRCAARCISTAAISSCSAAARR